MKGYGAPSRRIYSTGRPALVSAMTGTEPPEWQSRPGRFASDQKGYANLPVEGTARWRRMTGADRRARRVKLLLILIAALVGVAFAILKGS